MPNLASQHDSAFDEYCAPTASNPNTLCAGGPLVGIVVRRYTAVEEISRWVRKRSEALGRPVAVLGMTKDTSVVPDEAFRKALTHAFEELAPHIRCHAMVIQGHGFFASTLISFCSSLVLTLRRSTFPQNVFTDFPKAGPWIAQHVDDPQWPAERIASWLEHAFRVEP